MNRKERSLRRRLYNLFGKTWDAQAHEDSYSIGIADTSYGMDGVNGWIELKHVNQWAKTGVTKPKKYPPWQVNWLAARERKGGHCFVLIQIEEDYFIIPGNMARLVRKGMTKDGYMTICLGHWEKTIIANELRAILTG